VSYSVYLVHPLLLDAYDAIPFPRAYHHQVWPQVAVTAGFVAVLLACCALTHYLVEAPMQRLGRRIAARLAARERPERGPASVARHVTGHRGATGAISRRLASQAAQE